MHYPKLLKTENDLLIINIVIMDEASGALDPASEYAVNKSVLDNSSGKRMIIISHRLSTVQYADRIYCLSEGKVAECGTHKELIGLQGEYCSMYEKQAESYRIYIYNHASEISRRKIDRNERSGGGTARTIIVPHFRRVHKND